MFLRGVQMGTKDEGQKTVDKNDSFVLRLPSFVVLISCQTLKRVFSDLPDMFYHKLLGGFTVTGHDGINNFFVFQRAVDEILVANVVVGTFILHPVSGLQYHLAQ